MHGRIRVCLFNVRRGNPPPGGVRLLPREQRRDHLGQGVYGSAPQTGLVKAADRVRDERERIVRDTAEFCHRTGAGLEGLGADRYARDPALLKLD